MSDVKRYGTRSFVKTGKGAGLTDVEHPLSENLPKPNVIRIEVLPGYVRQHYVKGFYAAGDKIKQSLMNLAQDSSAYLPFYGILANEINPEFSVSASWSPSTKGGFATAATLVSDIAGGIKGFGKSMTGGKGKIGALGNLVGGAVSGIAGGVQGFVDTTASLVNSGERLLSTYGGIDNVSTGTTTVKTLQSVNLSFGTSATVKWYMPEQAKMCRMGIERLTKMAYVHSMAGNVEAQMGKAVEDLVQNNIAPRVDGKGSLFGDTDYAMYGDLLRKYVTQDNVAGVLGKIRTANEFFGNNMTVNPLPVRVSIGHILDLQPMVITNVSFHCSAEQFISEDGTHIPIWVSASINFQPWMNPGPDNEFFSFLGDEIFGPERTVTENEAV